MKHSVDRNHGTIVTELESCGISVLDLSKLGGGAQDLLCGYASINLLVEVKNRDSWYGRKGLQANQSEFAKNWRGLRPIVAYRAEEVLAEFNRLVACG